MGLLYLISIIFIIIDIILMKSFQCANSCTECPYSKDFDIRRYHVLLLFIAYIIPVVNVMIYSILTIFLIGTTFQDSVTTKRDTWLSNLIKFLKEPL